MKEEVVLCKYDTWDICIITIHRACVKDDESHQVQSQILCQWPA